MKNPIKARRIPSYVTTRDEHVELQHEIMNKWTMGLLIASVVFAFISTVFSLVTLMTSKKND